MVQTMVRKPAVAGHFYPREPESLRRVVLQHIETASVAAAPDKVETVVSPHAGYMYSGPTAGHAYARVRGKQPNRVVLLGCSHHYLIETASVFTRGSFETPLGTFPIDEAFAQRLADTTGSYSIEPHMAEHSLEVQLPFIAASIGIVPIVPVLFGGAAGEWHARVGEELARMTDEGDLVVVSTDLSHYLDEAHANEIDRRSIDTVLKKDWRAFAAGIRHHTCSMCGASAVIAAMTYAAARGASEWKVLDYRTSGATSGDFDRVVGYAALSMERAA
ncbi:MAG: MEMO1 family protein [Candidatus Hydrogenedentota bacterium]